MLLLIEIPEGFEDLALLVIHQLMQLIALYVSLHMTLNQRDELSSRFVCFSFCCSTLGCPTSSFLSVIANLDHDHQWSYSDKRLPVTSGSSRCIKAVLSVCLMVEIENLAIKTAEPTDLGTSYVNPASTIIMFFVPIC
ncbi:hypothetical protein Hanom_Chr15g01353821 [Helianthus anomalus]